MEHNLEFWISKLLLMFTITKVKKKQIPMVDL